MKLYDIHHSGKDLDNDMPLPQRAKDGTVAVCKNWGKEYLIRRGGKWQDVTHAEAAEQIAALHQ